MPCGHRQDGSGDAHLQLAQASDLADHPLGHLWHANLRFVVPALVAMVLLSAFI